MYQYVIALIVIVIIIKWNWLKGLVTQFTSGKRLENGLKNGVKQLEDTKVKVFAINDDGNFDLMDTNGKILNIGFGPNPKVYINLLDQSEKDTENFVSKVGDTKVYEIGGKPYTVDFTRLSVDFTRLSVDSTRL